MLEPALRDRDLTTTLLAVTDAELLGTDEPIDVFVLTDRGAPMATVFATVAPHGYNAAIGLLIGVSPDGHRDRRSRRPAPRDAGFGRRDRSRQERLDARSSTAKPLTATPPELWAIEQDEGEFDAISGATVTSRAVVGAVKNTLLYFEQHRDELYARSGRGRRRDAPTMTPTTNSWHEATAPLWRDNLALAQFLGLCPLLAVTTTLVNGLALGIASAARHRRREHDDGAAAPRARCRPRGCWSRMLILAALVTALDLFTEAVLYDLHGALGLFIPLIVVNSGLLAHAENVASRRSVAFTFLSALATGLGFLLVLADARRVARDRRPRHAARGHRAARRRRQPRTDARAAVRRHARRDACRPARSSAWALLLALRNRLRGARRGRDTPGTPR